ncbi:hypothetical protein C0995_009844 [Termitomyces sp. Mi166|nr:hypothetical protein C0995_009844 [Termitomyces sp. Mi166\
MASYALNAPTGPHKTQNSVTKLPCPSFATEAITTTPFDNYSLLGSAKVFSGTGMDQAHFLGTLQLRFTDQADFSRIADQQGLYEALVLMMQCLDCGAADDSLNVKAFFSFANTIIWIETNRCKACKCEAEEADLYGKPKTKKVKVSPALANHTLGSNAVLALLSQVDATLKATQLTEDGAAMPYSELQKHCDAVDLAVQHQLIFLDLSLQTFKMISERLDCLNKAFGPSDVK